MGSLIGREIHPYRVEEQIGEGGMGAVYRATDVRLGREVALKVLSPHLHADARARARLLSEARAVAALDHPHVASVYDVGETPEGQLYLAMAYYHGETLAVRIERGPLDPDEAVALTVQMARGLAAAHRAGLVHRDVKPANVIVLPDGGPNGGPCAKVLDFGIAKRDDSDLTQAGESLGTALYMSPEQLRGEPVDARTDVWGLGAVLYEMLTGHRPFGGAYAAAIGYAVLHEEPVPLAERRDDLPDGLDAVVRQCLAKDPGQRTSSMDALIDGLETVRRGVAAPARPEAKARSARPRWRWAVAALVAVALAAGTVVGLWPSEAEAEPQRLVVLPFEAFGADAEALSDGLVETVTSKLSGLAPLRDWVRIAPASEVGPDMTPSQARETLGAELVVEGTVRTEGDRVRVTLSLVDVSGSEPNQLGSREVDDASGSAFALQDEAVLEVASLLRDTVDPRVDLDDAARQSLAAGGTDDPEANQLYLRGRGELRNQQGMADLTRTRALFEEAIALDETFALAHAGLAEAEWQTYRTTSAVVWADRAVASAQRALALDDGLADVHTALGVIYQGRGEYGLALGALDRALAIDPRHAEATRQLAKTYAAQGRSAEAEAAFRQAIALAPDHWLPYNSYGVFFLNESRLEDAVAQFRQGLEIHPANLTLLLNLGVAEWGAGDLPAAAQAFERVLRLAPDDALAAFNLAVVRFDLGEYQRSVEAGERAVALQPEDYRSRLKLAEARWWAPGQRARARSDYAEAIALARPHLAVGRTPSVLLPMAGGFAATGQLDSARAYLREAESLLDPESSDPALAFQLGVTYEVAGQREEALRWLGIAFERGHEREHAQRSPWLASLRSSPAYTSTP